MQRALKGFLIFASMIVGLARAGDAAIMYEATYIGGDTWEYNYTVENDMLPGDIEEFTIFFDLDHYDNLGSASAPSDWDPLVIQPDGSLPHDGFYDALALGPGIAPGDSLGGFSVLFDFLGTGTPGSQTFDVVDPFTFDTLASGTTVLTPPVSEPVPEPGTIVLLGTGLLSSIGLHRRKSGKRIATS
jgi:hypothetical protein